MRRLLPVLIVAIGLAALAVDVLTLPRPFSDEPCDPPISTQGCIETRLGLDLQGGLRGEYRAVGTAERPVTRENLGDVRTIIENRINQYGVAEPIVQTQGEDRIVVEIPGVANPQQVRDLIGSTGQLEFIGVPPERNADVVDGHRIPPDLPVIFTGEEIDVARPGFDQQGQRAVDFELRPEGARLFDEYAAGHVGERFAIVLDEVVVSAPTLNVARYGGRGQITGGFTQPEVTNLVTVLRFGALPLEVEEVSFSQISATLGLDFLGQSVLAGAIGIVLVLLFMLLHYRLP
ncbi:MAG TPA: hypothetical protein VK992_03775, partial [Candidatus Caenarcaniphilales bacterium]|nr:hypothetical protein [Candidatus Caenarcaniphilales bacterium]